MNKYGESGHPWRIPACCLPYSEKPSLSLILGSQDRCTWNAFASFLFQARRVRRKRRQQLTALNDRFISSNFAAKRAAWRLKRRPSCRHGVLFSSLPDGTCPCMSADHNKDWSTARFMPSLDPILRCIVAVKFDPASFRRLGFLHAESRRLGWRR